jgi:uncharacterized protein (DUF2267 family)
MVDEAADFGDQLPMLVRGIYDEAGQPSEKPDKIRSCIDFLDRIAAQAPIKPEVAAVFRI